MRAGPPFSLLPGRSCMRPPRLGHDNLGLGVGLRIRPLRPHPEAPAGGGLVRDHQRELRRLAGPAALRAASRSPSAIRSSCTASRSRSARPTLSTSSTWASSSGWPGRSGRSGSPTTSAGRASSAATPTTCCPCPSPKRACATWWSACAPSRTSSSGPSCWRTPARTSPSGTRPWTNGSSSPAWPRRPTAACCSTSTTSTCRASTTTWTPTASSARSPTSASSSSTSRGTATTPPT